MQRKYQSTQGLIEADNKICTVIARNIDLLPIVFRFGIGNNLGQATIREVCLQETIDLEFFLAVINTYHAEGYFPEVERIDLFLLIDFLTKTHEYHKKVTIPKLESAMNKLHAELPDTRLVTTLTHYLQNYLERLIAHIEFEENEVFPLDVSLASGKAQSDSGYSLTKIGALIGQHVDVETEIGDLIMVILQHIPENADQHLFQDILHTLSHFEKEQVDHARFEDKILIPRMKELIKVKSAGHAQ